MSTKLRVLYSEDDPDSRDVMSLLLAHEGFDPVCPSSSQEALKLAKQGNFDIYLLDTWTPDISGLDVCRRIREFDSQTPIIFYSAAAFQADIDAALAAGAQAYITKPANPEEIISAIRSASTSTVGNC